MAFSTPPLGLIGLPGAEVFQQPSSAEIDAQFGIRINALSVSEMFDLYERTRFLYPAKRQRLAPVWPLVKQNWERLRKAGELLLCSMTVQNQSTGAISSITKWRSSLNGTLVQHLVSDGNPPGTRAVSMGATAASYVTGADLFHQNWFRPDNPFPSRVFGTLPDAAGPRHSAVHDLRLWNVRRDLPAAACRAGVVEPLGRRQDLSPLMQLVRRARGSLWLAIEELCSDPQLEAVDAIYQLIGLSRYRQSWIAVADGDSQPIMAAIAYRGPLGMNFSFLENRCELLIDRDADLGLVAEMAPALLGAAAGAYADFELPYIPVIACELANECLMNAGGEFLRNYSQSVWTREACPAFYSHIDRVYNKLLTRVERNGNAAHAC